MKRLVLIFLCLSIQFSFHPVEGEIIFFDGSYDEFVEKASEEEKAYFIEFFAPWCSKCIEMEQTTFRHRSVAEVVNKHYLALKLHAENFDAISLMQTYDIKGLPAMIFFNSKGEMVRKVTGYQTASRFLDVLESTK